jgi:hypothetical protein
VKSEWLNLKGWCQVVSDFGAPSCPFTPGGFRLLLQHGDTIAPGSAHSLID